MIQIEEWTNRKVGDTLFDSDIDDWSIDTSIFEERVLNKEHIIIIIEDEEGNKFGGYVSGEIIELCYYGYEYDSRSFVFSLESNGRMKEMKKFDIRDPQFAFRLYEQSDNRLFEFGDCGDIRIYKENDKTDSFCDQYSFEYKGIENILCGKERFTPKRIIVIEMK